MVLAPICAASVHTGSRPEKTPRSLKQFLIDFRLFTLQRMKGDAPVLARMRS